MPNPSTTKTDAAPPTTEDRLLAAMELLAQSNAAIVANTPIHKLTFDEWQRKNPQPTMPFPVYQNGFRVEADMLPAEALALLPKLQEGRFFGRRIHVYRDQSPDRSWHISYANKTMGQRIDIGNYGRDITEILRKLTTETPDLT